MTSPLPFIDLAAQQRALGSLIEDGISAVLNHGAYLMGPENSALEEELAGRTGRRHCMACASGTDALQMAMMALGVGPGDRVVVPDFTFIATAEAVRLVGAEPIFADIEPIAYGLCLDSVELALTESSPSIVGVIAVDLFGHPARSRELGELAARHGAWLIVDAAQSFGATRNGESALASGIVATTSFYPSKPLGGYGDGGAIFCDDDGLAEDLRSIRVHGSGESVGTHDRIGLTGRLDTIQAAVLLAKLEIFDQEVQRRQVVADRYRRALEGSVTVPSVADDTMSVWAQYTIEVYGRDDVKDCLHGAGIPTCVFYPRLVSSNVPYSSASVVRGGVPVAERATAMVLSLPMHAYLTEPDQDRIIGQLLRIREDQ